MSKVLVVAFDGMDKEMIEGYNLSNIPQEEFGSIDISGNHSVFTSELFVSFLTGKTFKKHGVSGLNYWDNSIIDSFENKAENYWFFRKFKGLRDSVYKTIGFDTHFYTREDYEDKTLFDKLDSVCIDVPGYRPVLGKGGQQLSQYGVNAAVRQQEAIESYKRNKLFEEIGNSPDFLMAHFHKVDNYHHWFWEVGKEEPVKEAYEEADEFAGKVIEAAQEKYDYIIFMSDHGLPSEKGHNTNAFYSCNQDLFGDDTPHITDFHNRVMSLVDSNGSSDGEDGEKLSQKEEQQVKENLEKMGYI